MTGQPDGRVLTAHVAIAGIHEDEAGQDNAVGSLDGWTALLNGASDGALHVNAGGRAVGRVGGVTDAATVAAVSLLGTAARGKAKATGLGSVSRHRGKAETGILAPSEGVHGNMSECKVYICLYIYMVGDRLHSSSTLH